ncbi:MAG: hypothetical protein ACI4JC_03175 [Faecalibacterium sp.]
MIFFDFPAFCCFSRFLKKAGQKLFDRPVHTHRPGFYAHRAGSILFARPGRASAADFLYLQPKSGSRTGKIPVQLPLVYFYSFIAGQF